MGDDQAKFRHNAVLRWVDADGNRWTAGAIVGHLLRDGQPDDGSVPLIDMESRGLRLVGFTVVKP